MDSSGAKGEIIVHYGGPVSPSAGFVLHSDDVLLEESAKVANGIAMTSGPQAHRGDGAGKRSTAIVVYFGLCGLGAEASSKEN